MNNQKTFLLQLPLLFALFSSLAGCFEDSENDTKKENSAVWATYASRSYEYDILALCGNCPNPRGFHTIVLAGEVFTTTALGADQNNSNDNTVSTIKQLFDMAGQVGVETTYNSQYGYPERVEITAEEPRDTSLDYSPPGEYTAGFEVKNFSLIDFF